MFDTLLTGLLVFVVVAGGDCGGFFPRRRNRKIIKAATIKTPTPMIPGTK